eukprot:7422428-Ditylum_brightwellii.AAC.1
MGWQQGAHFLLNCYCHWALLEIWHPGAPAVILHSKDEVTQEGSISMIWYGIYLIPLTELLKRMGKQ